MATENIDNPFELSGVREYVTEVPLGDLAPQLSDNDTPEKREIKRLRSEHELYTQNKDTWLFFLQSYEGGLQYVNGGNLFRHQREHPKSFNDRLQRSHYVNYSKALTDFVPDYIFAQPVERVPEEALKPIWIEFEKSVDRAGTTMDEFMRNVAIEARIFGMVWIGLDMPALPAGEDTSAISMARAKDLQIDYPYLLVVKPIEILDWAVDRFGRYTYLKRKQVVRAQDGFALTKIEEYTEWTPDYIQVSHLDVSDPKEVKILLQDVLSNRWKVIPFVPHFHERSRTDRDIGISFLQDIAFCNRSIYNFTSLIEEFLYRQCFNMLAMEESTVLPQAGRGEEDMGTSNVVEYPKGGAAPEYVSPSPDPAQFIQSERDETIREIYRSALQDAMSELSTSGQSGDAARQSMGRVVPMLAKSADSLQLTEVKVMTIWAKMIQKDWAAGKISYRDDFGIASISDMFLNLATIMNQLKVKSPSFWKHEWMRVIREFDGRIPAEVLGKIKDEIESMTDDEIEASLAPSKDIKAAPGQPSMGDMMQGDMQQSRGTDQRIAQQTGSKAATKERIPDKNKRTGKPSSQQRQ